MTISTIKSRRTLPITLAFALSSLVAISGCTKPSQDSATETQEQTSVAEGNNKNSAGNQANTDRLLLSYTDIAHAAYKDSLETAKALQTAVNAYVDMPNDTTLQAAKAAYRVARIPYSQTEVFRFDEGFVSANDKRAIDNVDGWEAQVNAWPLDEALIDYVDDSYEGEYNSKDNIINSDFGHEYTKKLIMRAIYGYNMQRLLFIQVIY